MLSHCNVLLLFLFISSFAIFVVGDDDDEDWRSHSSRTTSSTSIPTTTTSPDSTSSRANPILAGNVEGTPVYQNARIAHAVLGCLAFAFFFPLGAMLLRMSDRWLLHAVWQVTTLLAAVCTMGLGLYMAVTSQQLSQPHAILGLVVVCCAVLQPLTGFIHHRNYVRTKGRTGSSYVHILLGIMVVTAGTVNGGLGLQLSGETSWKIIVYGILAGLVWVCWMLISLLAAVRRRWDLEEEEEREERKERKNKRNKKEGADNNREEARRNNREGTGEGTRGMAAAAVGNGAERGGTTIASTQLGERETSTVDVKDTVAGENGQDEPGVDGSAEFD
ncbi:hypothetical protein QBC46DRAFT_446173 [Diplogelasinospora grovesii]|uniref:Cytochrome b561 domain-containing protein n=1 Tax=Diplogelasinospora grovesii TaxID=303347 RepID=A0AAN6NEE0_9PEZI|nr:hypothetical protein QBC46DRAFT_446173 [Diplogelasinospora grovesii]